MITGEIITWFRKKGFGFIKVDDEFGLDAHMFFHAAALVPGYEPGLRVGDRVGFHVGERNGRPCGQAVRPLKESTSG